MAPWRRRPSWVSTSTCGAGFRRRSSPPAPRTWRTPFRISGASLHFDDASLTAAADDFGHAIHRRPLAVLKPAAVSDVVRLLQFTSRHGIQVAARGQGHSTLGQAQVAAGVVIDLSTLATIHEVNDHDALVDAGVRWSELLRQTLPKGLAPTVLNDYIELSIGGTLSVGGVGSQSFRRGAQVDNVLELTVVTGRGELMTCSPTRHRQLFDAVRSGLGQFGVIVQARVRLVPALPRTRYYKATYDDLSIFLADLLRLVQEGPFDTVQGFVNVLTAARIPGWDYTLEATKSLSAASTRRRSSPRRPVPLGELGRHLLFRLPGPPGPTVAFLKQIGVWSFPHPWIDLLVPTSQAESFIAGTLTDLDPADVGQGPILVYPYLGSPSPRPISACRGRDLLPLRPAAQRHSAHARALGGAGRREPRGSTSRRGTSEVSSIRSIPCR